MSSRRPHVVATCFAVLTCLHLSIQSAQPHLLRLNCPGAESGLPRCNPS